MVVKIPHIEDLSHLFSAHIKEPFSLISVDINADLKNSDLGFLSGEELEIYSNYKFEKRQKEWLAGRLACKHAVSSLLVDKPDLSEISVHNHEHGRPYVLGNGCDGLHVSISHSGNFGMALACSIPCGLDVQEVVDSLDNVREKFIHSDEHELFPDSLDSELHKLGLVWAIKESLRKQVDLLPLLGFLETQIINAIDLGDCFIVNCKSMQHERELPEKIPTVFATMYKSHGLALCL